VCADPIQVLLQPLNLSPYADLQIRSHFSPLFSAWKWWDRIGLPADAHAI